MPSQDHASRLLQTLDVSLPEVRITKSLGDVLLLSGVLALLLVTAISIRLGLPHTSIYGHDLFISVDGGWRTLQGQRPHVDFYSTFGPVTYLLLACGIELGHNSVQGIVYATAGTGLLLGFWSMLLVRRRLSAFLAAITFLFLLFFWFAPFPLGEPFYIPGYAMQYNRLGYVLASFVVLELFVSVDEGSGKRYLAFSAFSTGLALSFLLFLKVSFFLVLGPLTAVVYVVRLKNTRHLLYAGGAFLVASLAFLGYLRWDVRAMLSDILTAIQVRGQQIEGPRMVIRALLRDSTEILTLLGVGVIAAIYVARRAAGAGMWRAIFQVFLLLALTLGADIALGVSNTQKFGFPLTIVAILILLDRIYKMDPGARGVLADKHLLFLMAVMVVFPTISDTLNAWTMQMAYSHKETGSSARIDAAPMAAMVFDDHADPLSLGQWNDNGTALVSDVDEGLRLLRRTTQDTDRLACLCFADPFTFALSRVPQTGGATFYQYGLNFTDKHAPTPKRILGDADVVLYSKSDTTKTTAALLRICERELSESFEKAGETEHWVLLRKRS